MKTNCNVLIVFCSLVQQVKGGLGQADPGSHERDGHPTGAYGGPWLHTPDV